MNENNEKALTLLRSILDEQPREVVVWLTSLLRRTEYGFITHDITFKTPTDEIIRYVQAGKETVQP